MSEETPNSKHQVWENPTNSPQNFPKPKRSRKKKQTKISLFLQKLKLNINATIPGYKSSHSKHRRKKKLKYYLHKIVTTLQKTFRRKRVSKDILYHRKKLRRELWNNGINGIKNILAFFSFSKKSFRSEDIIKRKVRQQRLEHLKISAKGVFSSSKKGKSKTDQAIKYTRRQIREMRIQKFKAFIKTIPRNFVFSIIHFFKSLFYGIYHFRKVFLKFKGDIQHITENKDLYAKLKGSYFISTLTFLGTFIVLYLLNQFITSFVCSLFGIPVKLYFYDMKYLVGPYSSVWNRFNIIMISGTAPFIMLFLSVIFYRLYKLTVDRSHILRMIFLWGLIHSFNFFFGAYITGVILRTGFVYFSEWIFFSYMFDIEEIIFLASSIIALITIGYFASGLFIQTAISRDLISGKRRVYYLWSVILLPIISGTSILIVISIPGITLYNLLHFGALLLIGIPSLLSIRSTTYVKCRIPKDKSIRKNIKILLIACAILILLLRVGLNWGVELI